MLKRILILMLAAALLLLSSCKVVDVIDHGTTAETTLPTEYEPWGFWYCHDSSSAIELKKDSNKAKIYTLTTGYYEYDGMTEVDCTFDGTQKFTLTLQDETYTLTFQKYANTLLLDQLTYIHMETAPAEHVKYSYPKFDTFDLDTYVSVGEIDFSSLASTVLEGAAFDIAVEFYGSKEKIPAAEGVTRPVQSGDFVNIDYSGKLDGVAFAGGTATNVALLVSDYKNGYIPGFTDGIIGHTVGETFDVDVTFPENYHTPDLAGKAVVFTMTLNAICNLTLTDEQVAEYKQNSHTTYAEWLEVAQESVAKKLTSDAILRATTNKQPLPDEVYLYFYQQTADYFHLLAFYYGIDYQMLLSFYGKSEQSILQQAINDVTYYVALYALLEENELSWSEEDYVAQHEAHVTEYLETNKDSTREEAVAYADRLVDLIKTELAEKVVLEWAFEQIFATGQE